MARSIWTGAISFGLVTVPVKLYTATQSHTVSFKQFQEGTGERIRYKRVAESTGEEVDYGDIVKGAEVGKGRYVIVTPEELEAIEPGRSRTIDIEDFVEIGEIDPICWDKTYYLGPAGDVGADRPYKLLLEALRASGKVGIARYVMRGKQYLATIRPVGDALALETMYFADEVREAAKEVEGLPVEEEVDERQLAIAQQLIDAMTTEWDHDKYRDTYTERVHELIAAKAEGEDVVVEPEDELPQVVDLMAALRASVEASRGRAGGASAPSAAEPAPAAAPSADGLDELSKDELYERAADAGVPGRSKMTKDELLDALRERQRAAS